MDVDGDALVQVAWGPICGARDGEYVLETRGPHRPEHASTIVTDLADVNNAFSGFLADDNSWADHLARQRVDL